MILLDQSLSETYKEDFKIRKKNYNHHVVIIDFLILIILGSSQDIP